VKDGAVTVAFMDDRGIRDLNARFRGRDRATDVLAFPCDDPRAKEEPPIEESGVYLGDVAISLERAREQAPRYHHAPEDELARLLVHGILHLLEYDHHRPADGRRMKAAERRALSTYEPGTLWKLPGPLSA
jgi:rRNA maturation RNase YbeY